MNQKERKSYKQRITKLVIEQLTANDSNNTLPILEFNDSMKKWWYISRNNGFRLTKLGDDYFKLAGIEYYNFSFKLSVTPQNCYYFLRAMNSKIDCPYYLQFFDTKNNLRLYDDKIAMMVNLYGGILEYLRALEEIKKR